MTTSHSQFTSAHAAQLLAGQRHFLVLGMKDEKHHASFFQQVHENTDEFQVVEVHAEYRPTLPLPVVSESLPPNLPRTSRPYLLGFLPDSPPNRLALATVVLQAAGTDALHELMQRTDHPILALPSPSKGRRERRMLRDYQMIIHTLEAVPTGNTVVLGAS